MKYAWIQQHSDSFCVQLMCRVLEVSKSAYYAWKKREPGPRKQRTDRIRRDVSHVFEASNQIYGSYKIAQEMEKSPNLETACRNTVAKAIGFRSQTASASLWIKSRPWSSKILNTFILNFQSPPKFPLKDTRMERWPPATKNW